MARHATYRPGQHDAVLRELCQGQPDIIEVTTPSTSGTELEIAHGLERVPKGWCVLGGDDPGRGYSSLVTLPLLIPLGPSPAEDTAILGYVPSSGHTTSKLVGYYATAPGEIVGLSGAFYCSNDGDEADLTLIAYKNTTNVLSVEETDMGVEVIKVSTTGNISFEAGDTLSMLVSIGAETTLPAIDGGVGSLCLRFGLTLTDWTKDFLYLKFPQRSQVLTVAVW